MTEPVPLSELERDLPAPPDGWAAELAARGVEIVLDDLGRRSISRADAAALFTAHRSQQEAAARRRVELEEQLVAADEARRRALPRGVPAGAVPEGLSAAQLMMLSDPMDPGSRRESVLEHSLANPGGGLIFHPIRDEQADQ
jgi:ParB-like chromosome segregation protein Spo0J